MTTTMASTARAFLLPFAADFRHRGFEVDLAAAGASACQDCIRAFGQVFDLPWSRSPASPSNIEAALILRNLLAGGYDVVHTHTPVASLVVRMAVASLPRAQRPAVVYTAHGFHFYRGGPRLRNLVFLGLEKIAGLWTDRLIVINREDEDAARRYRIVPVNRLRYVPGIGIDTDVYHPEAVDSSAVDRVRSELGLNEGDSLFLMVAEFMPGKRHRDAVQALERLANPSVHLAFAGTGPTLELVQAEVARLGLQARVHLLGFRRDIPQLMRASVATLMPSEREGLNRSVMESLSLEVPVIGSDARGVRDLLEGRSGVIVPVGDVDGLAGAMAWVLDHPEEAREMARRGRERMVANHDIRVILKQYEEIYEELLGGRRLGTLMGQARL